MVNGRFMRSRKLKDTWLFAAATTSGSAVHCNRVVRAESRAAAAGGKDRRVLTGNPST